MAEHCEKCRGSFEPLSRQATQNIMGPWQVRNERNPFVPGVSYEMLKDMAAKGKVARTTVVRGPGTKQFWSLACNAPGVAVLLGECHNCHAAVRPDEFLCSTCGAVLTCSTDRQHLGLGPVKLLPGDAPPYEVASSAMNGAATRPVSPADAASTQHATAVVPFRLAPASRGQAARRLAARRAETMRSALAAAVVFLVIVATVATVSIYTAWAPERPAKPATTKPPAIDANEPQVPN